MENTAKNSMRASEAYEELVKKRIREVIEKCDVSVYSIAREVGVNERTMYDQVNGKSKIGVTTIISLLKVCKSISADWLLLGEGNMYRSNATPSAPYINTPGAHDNITNVGSGTQIVGAGVKPTRTKEEAMAALISQNEKLLSILSQDGK